MPPGDEVGDQDLDAAPRRLKRRLDRCRPAASALSRTRYTCCRSPRQLQDERADGRHRGLPGRIRVRAMSARAERLSTRGRSESNGSRTEPVSRGLPLGLRRLVGLGWASARDCHPTPAGRRRRDAATGVRARWRGSARSWRSPAREPRADGSARPRRLCRLRGRA